MSQTYIPTPIQFNDMELDRIDREICKLLSKNIVEHTDPSAGQYISNIFFRPKKDGSIRLILNLKELNFEVEYHHFKMETLQHAIQLMTPGCYMASVDLKDAYYTIPVCKADRKFLRFFWRGKLFQFTCLPNGLAEAPRKFTKLLKAPFAHLRARGHMNSAYIDDSCLVARTFENCASNVTATVTLLDSLGFTVHPLKSCLIPTQILAYLGFILDSVSMTVRLTPEKAGKIVHICSQLLKQSTCTIRECAAALGTLVAAEPGVDFAPLHYKRVEHEKICQLKLHAGDFEAKMQVTDIMRQDLSWWAENATQVHKVIHRGQPSVQIFSDSSNTAWGGVYGDQSTGGPWAGEECGWHINVKELMAAFFTLKAFCSDFRDTHVRLNVDNTTSVVYINKQGGKKPQLNDIARDMWLWAQARCIWLSAVHIPGVENCSADSASRTCYDTETEWQLDPNVFKMLETCFGPFGADLFASRLNTQCPVFFSWRPDPNATAIDALAHPWPDTTNYAFPPFSIINRLLQKVEMEEATLLLIAPLWTTQVWFARILHMCVDYPLLLPRRDNLLQLPQDPSAQHELHRKLHLTAFLISGKLSQVQDFQSRLPILSCQPGETQLWPNIGRIGQNGSVFVVNGRCLHCNHLCKK